MYVCVCVLYIAAASTVGYDQSGSKSLADDYEYAMFGRVFKFVDDASGALHVAVHASFGGLLMQLVVRFGREKTCFACVWCHTVTDMRSGRSRRSLFALQSTDIYTACGMSLTCIARNTG